ncbi:MAG: hypothetical protein R3309_13130 [Reinekea sp.]|nr:hypothetical protein [Reinekea sp.]
MKKLLTILANTVLLFIETIWWMPTAILDYKHYKRQTASYIDDWRDQFGEQPFEKQFGIVTFIVAFAMNEHAATFYRMKHAVLHPKMDQRTQHLFIWLFFNKLFKNIESKLDNK